MAIYTLETNGEYTPTNWQTGDVISAQKMNNIEGGVNTPTVTMTASYDMQSNTWTYGFQNNAEAWEAVKNRNGGQVWIELINGNMTEYWGLWNVKISQVLGSNSDSYYLSLWRIDLYQLDGSLDPRLVVYTTELTNWTSGGTPTMSEITGTSFKFARANA